MFFSQMLMWSPFQEGFKECCKENINQRENASGFDFTFVPFIWLHTSLAQFCRSAVGKTKGIAVTYSRRCS